MQPSQLKCLGLAVGLFVLGGSAQAALVDAGNGLINDTVLDITWVADASLSGSLSWAALVSWADALVYGGSDDWRLASLSSTSPTNTVFNCSGGTEQDCIDSGNELGYMFNYNIAGSFPKTGDQTVGSVTLTDIQNLYWSGTQFARSPGSAWNFFPFNGLQVTSDKVSQYYGWAVRSGQAAAVPLPGTALMMALGFGAMAISRRARRRFW